MPTKDGSIVSATRRGSLSFDIVLETSGFCVLEIEASSLSAGGYNPPIPFFAILNGNNLGGAEASANQYTFSWLTQWMPAGKHRLTIDNRNLRAGSSLAIHSVKLLRHQGEDYDKNTIPDWLENHFKTLNHVTTADATSYISPACVEGIARRTDEVKISSSGNEVTINSGVGNAWYANVPLNHDSDTKFDVSYENGHQSQNCSIHWLETNLLECPDEIRVRVGDSLKLSAISTKGSQSQLVTMNGELLSFSTETGNAIVAFDAVGVQTLVVSSANNSKRTLRTVQVKVYGADFGQPFDVASGSERKWNLPGVSRDLHLQADPLLSLREIAVDADQARCVGVTSQAKLAASPVVVARLYENGPIVAATTLNSFYFAASTVTNNSAVIRVLPDGTRVVRATYAIDGKIPADLSIWIEMYVTDAVFANGDTWWNLTAADFNENGEASLEYYKAPGKGTPYICHWIRPYMEKSTKKDQ
jgi:hypothetical protein